MMMKIRTIIPGLSAAMAGVLATGCSGQKSQVETEKMNILFIGIEDWNAEAIGCYGNPIVQTPAVDNLAARGILFTKAYCQGTVSNPSRASLTTGLRPDATGVYGNPDHFDNFITDEHPYLAAILKQKGAHTAQTGKLMHKWRLSYNVINHFDQIEMEKPFADATGVVIDQEPDRGPFRGVQKYTQTITGLLPPIPERDWTWVPDRVHDSILVNLKKDETEKFAAGHPDTWALRKPFQQYHAEMTGDDGFIPDHQEDGIVTRLGIQMIEDFAREDRQFFLSVGLYAPHTPLLVPGKYLELYDTALISTTPATRDKDRGVPSIAVRNGNNYDNFNGLYPQFSPTQANQKMAIASYYAISSFIDEQIGRLLKALDDNGLADNTIVVLWADHGFHLGEHGCWSKFTLFEQSIRVPLIVYVPGAPGNGQRCDEIVELVDLLPTMCDLWGIEPDERFEGLSFVPLLEDPRLLWKKAAFTIVPAPLNGRSVRTKQYKYAEYGKTMALPGTEKPVAVELYDLYSDPYEQVNLAGNGDYAVVEDELRQMLLKGWRSALPESTLTKR